MGTVHIALDEVRAEERINRRRHNPCGDWWKLPAKIALEPEFRRTAPLTAPQQVSNEERFSLPDILGIPKTTFLPPIGEGFEEAAQPILTVPLPLLTNATLDQLILWRRERGTQRDPGEKSTDFVFVKKGDEFFSTGRKWSDVAAHVRAGTHGVEQPFSNIHAYVQSRKPELTAEYLLEALKCTREKLGRRSLSLEDPVWHREPSSNEITQSLYNFKEISVIMLKADPEVYGGAHTFTQFKRMHGFASGKAYETPTYRSYPNSFNGPETPPRNG